MGPQEGQEMLEEDPLALVSPGPFSLDLLGLLHILVHLSCSVPTREKASLRIVTA